MDNPLKLLVLKEQPYKIHREKLNDILTEAEYVGKEYLRRKYPVLWPKLQNDFKNQKDFLASRNSFNGNNIIDIEPKHLDITNYTKLLQNARSSPFCCKNTLGQPLSLYSEVWVNPTKDIKMKLEALQAKLRSNCSSNDEEELFENDIKEIVGQSSTGSKKCNINSYMWLLNEERPAESLLSAYYNKNGVNGYLSALKLAFQNFDCSDYAYVISLSVLRSKRNTLHAISDEFIPLASYNKDYYVINEVIHNIFGLIDNVCKDDKENQEFRSTIQGRIEHILSRTSYETESREIYQKSSSLASALSSLISSQENQDTDQNTSFIPQIANSKNVTETKISITFFVKLLFLSVTGLLTIPELLLDPAIKDNGQVCLAIASAPAIPAALNDKDAKKENRCDICNISVSKASEMKAHKEGRLHRNNSIKKNLIKQFSEFNQAVSESPAAVTSKEASSCSIDQTDAMEIEEKKKRALYLTLNAFVNSFEPIPIPCATLRFMKVLTPSEYEKIQSKAKRDDRVVEFLDIIQQKHNWFEHLKTILVDDFINLRQLLDANLMKC